MGFLVLGRNGGESMGLSWRQPRGWPGQGPELLPPAGCAAPGCFKPEIVIIKFLLEAEIFPRVLPLVVCRNKELFSFKTLQQGRTPQISPCVGVCGRGV